MEKKALRQNLLFAGLILLAAGLMFGWRAWHNAQNQKARLPLRAELYYGETGTTMPIDLNEDGRYDIDTGKYVIHLQVRDHAIRFVDSPCPDHICESYGWLSMEDQMATCMPAYSVLTIVPNESAD